MFKAVVLGALLVVVGSACASKLRTLPPLKSAPPAASPAEVERALPGTWIIDVEASADALARTRFLPRQVTTVRRDSNARETPETVTTMEPFDSNAYQEARRYWLDLLSKPDMKWRLVFQAGGTGEHWAVVSTGQPAEKTPFAWRLDGWILHLDYAADSRFKSFETTMESAMELHYPMAPLGDFIVLRRSPR
jgi:hypothetical protein